MDNIIVGTDFSDESKPALAQALRVAKHSGGKLLLVHALDQSLRDIYPEVLAKLEAVQAECIAAGVDTKERVVIGYPDTSIPSTARDVNADLVVVGTHGRTGVKRYLMGSVAERVVRSCETNVMVARERSAGEGGYKRVLVPTDFSQAAENALVTATRIAAPDAKVELFHAWQLPGAVTGYWGPAADNGAVLGPLRSQVVEAIEGQARRLLERHTDLHPGIQFVDKEDVPTHAIRKQLEDGEYDLVVMGSHGRRGFRRWMLGSVAEMTVRYAPCSVLVVHAGEINE